MRYEIEGNNLPVVICHLEEGEKIITEQGAMAWMTPNMKMETNSNGIGRAVARTFSGESFFQNIYYPCRGRGKGMIAFASSFPGTILPFEIEPGNEIIAQKKHFSQQQKECSCLLFLIKKSEQVYLVVKVLSCKN